MGINQPPEIILARKIHKQYSLQIPFDLDSLVSKYAKIIYKPIPIDGIDGVCINLKFSNRKPTVIVNSDAPKTRQRFTLAHELGHIIIPWHYGTIVDVLDEKNTSTDKYYEAIEREANRFASELLMPFDFIYSLYIQNSNLDFLRTKTVAICGVSEIAADIRISQAISEIINTLIPPNSVIELFNKNINLSSIHKNLVDSTKFSIKDVARHLVQHIPGRVAYCIEKNGLVIDSGCTKMAFGNLQFEGEEFENAPYPHYKNYTTYTSSSINTHWWILDNVFILPEDYRTWKEILHSIANDIASTPSQIEKFKTTVNAKLSGAHGNWVRKNPTLGVDEFIEDSIQRFNNKEYYSFATHPDFLAFIRKRCFALHKIN